MNLIQNLQKESSDKLRERLSASNKRYVELVRRNGLNEKALRESREIIGILESKNKRLKRIILDGVSPKLLELEKDKNQIKFFVFKFLNALDGLSINKKSEIEDNEELNGVILNLRKCVKDI